MDVINEKEFLKNLVWNNYIKMLERRDICALKKLKNDPNSLLSLLYSVGASEEITKVPAYREKLEEHLGVIIESSLWALGDECDIQVRRTKDGFETNLESLRLAEKYKLEFPNENTYEFNVGKNVGEVSRRVRGDIKKRTIAEYTKTNSNPYSAPTTSENFTESNVDEKGFIASKSVVAFINKSGKTSKVEKKIKREGQKITITSDKGIEKTSSWNGRPNSLNTTQTTNTDFALNMNRIILKYPETREYYESIIGKETVSKVLEICGKSRS